MSLRDFWHNLWHYHNPFTKEGLNATVHVCVPRIWWRPWHIDVDRTDLIVVSHDSPIHTRATVTMEQFEDLLRTTSRTDFYTLLAKLAERKENDRI